MLRAIKDQLAERRKETPADEMLLLHLPSLAVLLPGSDNAHGKNIPAFLSAAQLGGSGWSMVSFPEMDANTKMFTI